MPIGQEKKFKKGGAHHMSIKYDGNTLVKTAQDA
jgi:hypothetical protein